MSKDTFPAALVEAQAEAMMDAELGAGTWKGARLRCFEAERRMWRARAVAALSALPADVQAVARGEAVAVPVERTEEMKQAYYGAGYWGGKSLSDAQWDAMLAASPYAQEPPR